MSRNSDEPPRVGRDRPGVGRTRPALVTTTPDLVKPARIWPRPSETWPKSPAANDLFAWAPGQTSPERARTSGTMTDIDDTCYRAGMVTGLPATRLSITSYKLLTHTLAAGLFSVPGPISQCSLREFPDRDFEKLGNSFGNTELSTEVSTCSTARRSKGAGGSNTNAVRADSYISFLC